MSGAQTVTGVWLVRARSPCRSEVGENAGKSNQILERLEFQPRKLKFL